MTFHNVNFPASLSFGSVGGPERRTEIVTLSNGFEERNTPWESSRRRYDASLGLRNLDDLEAVISFFEARRGKLHAFRWKDWLDFKSCPGSETTSPFDQSIGSGDGEERSFKLVKNYVSGDYHYCRDIRLPKPQTISIAVDGMKIENSEWSLNEDSGAIIFLEPPSSGSLVSAGYEFDVPVRFDTDLIQASAVSFQVGEIPEIPIVEVRLP